MRANPRAKRVWQRLIQAYGSRVAESYGAEVPQPWCDAVEDFTDEQITYGLRHVIRESIVHPPTLGQFIKACQDMPLAKTSGGPSVQELLCAYATLKLHGKIQPSEFSRPWTYLYREWIDADKPKHLQRCAECTGVLIELNSGDSIRINTIDMQAEPELHARALRSFKPGPRAGARDLLADPHTRARLDGLLKPMGNAP